MWGAIDIMEATKYLEEENANQKPKKESELRNMLSWEEVKTTYTAYKLGRRKDALHGLHWQSPLTGKQFSGLECQAGVYQMTEEGEAGTDWQKADGFIPERNKCVYLRASRYNSGDSWLRTSIIVDFYIHEDYENSADKIVLPSWAPLDILDGVEFAKGDILLRTMNSFYFLKAQERKEK
jgi:hypothetical protein